MTNGEAGLGERELTLLTANRYALSDRLDASDPFSRTHLRAALEDRVESLSGSAGIIEKRVPRERSDCGDPARTGARGSTQGAAAHRRRLVRCARQACADRGANARARLRPRRPGCRDGRARARASPRAAPTASTTMEYSSPGAMAVRGRHLVAGDARTLSIASMVGVLAILAWVYRSPVVVALCVFPALCGLLAGVLIVDAAFGSLHAIALAFGATLLGEAVDYPSYLLTQVGEGAPAPGGRGAHRAHDRPRRAHHRVRRLRAPVQRISRTRATRHAHGSRRIGRGRRNAVGPAARGARGLAAAAAAAMDVARAVGRARARHSPWRWAIVVFATAGAVALAWRHPWWNDDLAAMNPLPASGKGRRRAASRGVGCAGRALCACRRGHVARGRVATRGGAAIARSSAPSHRRRSAASTWSPMSCRASAPRRAAAKRCPPRNACAPISSSPRRDFLSGRACSSRSSRTLRARESRRR